MEIASSISPEKLSIIEDTSDFPGWAHVLEQLLYDERCLTGYFIFSAVTRIPTPVLNLYFRARNAGPGMKRREHELQQQLLYE